MLLSQRLEEGEVYTRLALVPITGVKGVQALYTGVFRQQTSNSILLFVTQIKKTGRTAYDDRLEGDTLHWDGQEQRGTDANIIEAAQRGLELLVFYRQRWNEFPGDAFRYIGQFHYVSHQTSPGPGATHFVLRRSSAATSPQKGLVSPALPAVDADDTPFDPTNAKDAREQVLRAIKAQVQDTCKKWSQGCRVGEAGPLGDLTDHATACPPGDFDLDLPNAEAG